MPGQEGGQGRPGWKWFRMIRRLTCLEENCGGHVVEVVEVVVVVLTLVCLGFFPG